MSCESLGFSPHNPKVVGPNPAPATATANHIPPVPQSRRRGHRQWDACGSVGRGAWIWAHCQRRVHQCGRGCCAGTRSRVGADQEEAFLAV